MRRTLLLGAILLAGWSPLMAEHPEVAEGNRRLEAGDAEGALRSYERAEKQAGPRPEIDYDRGGAFYRLGRFGEAREAYQKALEAPGLASQGAQERSGSASIGLAARDAYNLGNALAHLGDANGAIRAYRRALAFDPADEDARYNLEVMLRRRSEGKTGPPPDARHTPQAPDGGPRDAGPGEDGGRDGGGPDDEADTGRDAGSAAGPDGGRDPRADPGDTAGRTSRRSRADGGRGDGGERDEATGELAEMQDSDPSGGRRPAVELSRQEAVRLLDAMREREKNMPMRPVERRRGRERDVAKDW